MALLHLDGFDTYSSTTDVAARYPGSTTANMSLTTTGGRFGGGAVVPSSGTSLSLMGSVIIPHSGANPIIAGGATWFSAANNCPVLTFQNSTGNAAASGSELSLTYQGDLGGILQLRRGPYLSGNGTIVASTTVGFPGNLWHFVEMKATVADSGGIVEVRVNGVTVLTYTGDTRLSNTGTPGIDRVNFATYSSNTTTGGAWDDIYVLDTSGSAPLNDFLGDCRVNTLAPTSDASVQFTRSTGASNYLTVDEGRMNSDTDYVESSTVGHIDRYGYGDLPATVATAHAVQVTTWAKKTDATTRTMRNKVVSGATTSNGASYSLLTGYAPYVTLLSTDPATSAAWTVSAVNGLTAGFEVVS